MFLENLVVLGIGFVVGWKVCLWTIRAGITRIRH